MKNKFLKLTHSAGETKRLGFELARKLSEQTSKNEAKAIILKGNLGAGKTTFALGFLDYFGIKPHAASPTFVIMKKYKPKPKTKKTGIDGIYHLDAYRLHSKKDLNVLGFNEILNNPKNIILIEWPERVKGISFKNKTVVFFSYAKNESERIVSFRG